jgi:hypothetical protein
MAQSLNMDDYVAPHHWSVKQFEHCDGLDPKREFELIAPVLIYFSVDATTQDNARTALSKLRKAKHPLFESSGHTVQAILQLTRTPEGLINRYNALVMWLAEEVQPDIESYIDKWGAYAFKIGQDNNILAGDASGVFAYFRTFSHLQDRILLAVDAVEEEATFA